MQRILEQGGYGVYILLIISYFDSGINPINFVKFRNEILRRTKMDRSNQEEKEVESEEGGEEKEGELTAEDAV